MYKQSSAYQNFMEEQNLKEQELNQPATPSKATSSDPKRSKAKKSKPEVVVYVYISLLLRDFSSFGYNSSSSLIVDK